MNSKSLNTSDNINEVPEIIEPEEHAIEKSQAVSQDGQQKSSQGRCAGVFFIAAVGMVYFTLVSSYIVAVVPCSIGFIMATAAIYRAKREDRFEIAFFSVLGILFFFICAGVACQYVEGSQYRRDAAIIRIFTSLKSDRQGHQAGFLPQLPF